LTIKQIKAFKMDFALTESFSISFETFTRVQNVIVVVEAQDGTVGYSESAPLKPITGDSQQDALRFLRHASKMLTGKPVDPQTVHEHLTRLERKTRISSSTAIAAIDMACYDIIGKREKKPIYKLLGASKPHLVPTSLTVGIKTPEETAQSVQQYMERFKGNGLRCIKLKISGRSQEDLARVSRVADVFPGEITLDANQGYKDPKAAADIFKKMHETIGSRIILVEEPCPKGDLKKMKYVNDNSPIPIFADESVTTVDDARKVVQQGCASGINIKLEKAGGIYYARKIGELAAEKKLRLMVGCMLETYLALAGSINFIAATPSVLSADIDNDLLMVGVNTVREDPKDSFIDGARVPTDKPGLGVELADWLKATADGQLSLRQVV
jgi:L-alanine-DL-glutamate epimerase-like enolase superfamily enzyme